MKQENPQLLHPPTNNLKGCDTYEELVCWKACIFLIKDCSMVQIWPHKTLQSYSKSVTMPYFSQQPMPRRKRQDGEDPAHSTRL